MESYFVIIYKKGRTTEEVEVLEIKHFHGLINLFDWMQKNREELFSVYEGNCVLDYS